MYPVLFVVGERAVRQLTRASEITDELMPKVGVRRTCELARLHGLNAGWFHFRSDPPADEQFATDERTDQHLVLAYGEVYGFSSAAAEVLRAWRTSGLDGVRRLDGSFSTVLLDRSTGSVHIVSDLVGRRTLRWFADHDALLVSSHDLPIVATGLCRPEIDLCTAATILSTEWSLQGRSLLRNVHRCSPHYVVTWDGETSELYRPLIALDNRLDECDQLGQEKLREEMIELTSLHARHVCGDRERIFSDLTAGFDSRAGLAVLSSAVKTERLILQTSGSPSNFEAMVAGRIAEQYGLTHKITAPQLSDRDAFWENCKARAFFLNGDTDAKRSFASPVIYNPRGDLHFIWGAGEIFRGYLYKSAQTTQRSFGDVLKAVREKFRWPWTWQRDALQTEIDNRMEETLADLARLSSDFHDLCDLFYLYERMAHWAPTSRLPGSKRQCLLLERAGLVTAALRFPSPVGNRCLLQHELIRRFLPEVYSWPFNNYQVLPVDEHGTPLLAPLVEICPKPGLASDSADYLRSELLSLELRGPLADLLGSSESIGTALLGPLGVWKAIEKQRSGEFIETFGWLVTMEFWREQIQQAFRLATSRDSTSAVAI
jgi:hypothetical protein